jgi:spore germination protein KB
MFNNNRISSWQFMTLVVLFTVGNTIINAPTIVVKYAKQDAYLSALFALGMGLFIVYLYSLLAKKFPSDNLYQLCERLFGKWLGKMVSLLFIIYFFILTALMLRQTSDFLTTTILSTTPIESIFIIMTVLLIFGVKIGIESIARASEIFLLWVIFLFIIFMIMVVPEIDVKKIQPFMDHGFRSITHGAFDHLSTPYLQLIVFLVISSSVYEAKNKLTKSFITGTLIGGTMLVIVLLLCLLVLGADNTARDVYPTFLLAKQISIGKFLERVEVIIAFIWLVTLFFKALLLFFASIEGISKVLNLKEHRIITIPLGIILVILSIKISPNIVYYKTFFEDTFPFYGLTMGLFLPLIMLTRIKFMKKSVGNERGND